MGDAIDMIKLADGLPKRPRGRACIVLSRDYFAQKPWAAELAKRTGVEHIDLLDVFGADDDLAMRVSSFSVKELFNLLQSRSSSPVLIVTGAEFIKATWSANISAIEQFASQVETWGRSPALLFVMQFDSELAKRKFKRFRQYKFVVDQKETLALT